MDIQTYLQRKEELKKNQPQYRKLCLNCAQPTFSCFCSHIKAIETPMDFVILIHPIEVRRRIATGRMAHLVLKNSLLIKGQDFSDNEKVNHLIEDNNRHCVVLYPNRGSINLTPLSFQQRAELFPKKKKLTIFIIDGTWATAGRMIRSQNLFSLPRICFTPVQASNFRVRKQPANFCLSSIEAIHHTIELLAECQGLELVNKPHDNLLKPFEAMVNLQLSFIENSKSQTDKWRKTIWK